MSACAYCLRRAAQAGRRCGACQAYLERLHASDDQAARCYAARLVLLAAIYTVERLRGGSRR